LHQVTKYDIRHGKLKNKKKPTDDIRFVEKPGRDDVFRNSTYLDDLSSSSDSESD